MTSIRYTTKINSTDSDVKIISSDKYEEICKNTGCYEIIPDDENVKVYFDIDYKKPTDMDAEDYDDTLFGEILNRAVDVLNKFCIEKYNQPNPRYTICQSNSSTLWKISIHIIIENVIATKKTQRIIVDELNDYAKKFTDVNDYMPDLPLFDTSVYSSKRKMRSLWCSKVGEDRPLVLHNGTFEGHCISSFISDDAVVYHVEPIEKPYVAPSVVSETDTDNEYLKWEEYINAGLLAETCKEGTHNDYCNVGYALINVLGKEKAKTLFHKLTMTYGSENKKDEFECRFNALCLDHGKNEKCGRITLMNYAKKVDADKVKDINKKYVKLSKKILSNDNAELKGVQTDMEATEIVYELYPHWVFCLGILYVFNQDTGMWDNSKTAYFNIIKKFKKELVLIIVSKTGLKQSNKSYGDTLALMEKIPPLIKTLCHNDNWLRENEHTSLGKLLFHNGYINLKEKKFYSKDEYGFNPKIVFMGKIHQDFEMMSESDMAYVEDVKQRLFITPLGNDVGDYFILNLARGLAGDMMKRTLFCLGGTDCGKSIATKAITLSCGDYVGAFNAENLAYRNSSNDEGQIMRWMLLLKYKRLIFSNELKSTVELNGNMIKKCASGGDPMVGRSHGKEEESFIAHFLSILFANDLPKIKPYDTAVDNRVKVLPYEKRFVDEPSNEYELKKDHNIEQEMKTLKFQKAIVAMLINRYFQYLDDNLYIDPKEVIQGKKDWIDLECDYVVTFLKDYEITNDEVDYVLSSDIQKWIDCKKLGITMTKFAKELKKHCKVKNCDVVKKNDKKIKGKTCKCWVGIKEIEEIEEIDK